MLLSDNLFLLSLFLTSLQCCFCPVGVSSLSLLTPQHLVTRVGVFRDSTGEWMGKSTSLSDWEYDGADVMKWGAVGDIPGVSSATI